MEVLRTEGCASVLPGSSRMTPVAFAIATQLARAQCERLVVRMMLLSYRHVAMNEREKSLHGREEALQHESARITEERSILEHEWEKLSVTSAGPSLSVSTGDRELFDAADPHPVAGGTGLAAAGPGEASFDEFVIDPADAP